MTLPRMSSLFLALGGGVWACALLSWTYGFFRMSAPGGSVWLLIWLPGFFAWYGYIRHSLGHFLFRRARITWLVSLGANFWSLAFIGSYSLGGLNSNAKLPTVLLFALGWICLAILLSLACLINEWSLREPEAKR